MLMIASFFAAALATVLAVPLIKGLATRLNVMDHPVGGRHIHTTPVPRLGGVAVFLPALAVALVGLHVLAGRHELSIHGRELLGLLAGTAIVFGVGIYDDICGLSAPLKLAGQVGAAILLY